MTPVNVQRKGFKQPRALQIPQVSSNEFIDDVAYPFGFEFFGPTMGTQRLIHRTDDSLKDYLGDQYDVLAAQTGPEVQWFLFDSEWACWVILNPGDWVVEGLDGIDGFVRFTDEQFHQIWEVVNADA